MTLTDDFTLKCMKGSPVFLDDICAIYPRKLGDIVDIGYSTFLKYINLFNMEKPSSQEVKDNELSALLNKLDDFQYFLFMVNIDSESNQLAKNAFHFFTHEQVIFSLEQEEIIIGPPQEKHLMVAEDFYNFRKILRRMYFLDVSKDDIVIEEDDDPRVRAIKKKLLERKKKLKKIKTKDNDSNIEFSDLIGSLTLNNCGLNMENIWNITYYAFHDQLKRMGWRDQFNINNQMALAGAKVDKEKLKHWIKSISSEN